MVTTASARRRRAFTLIELIFALVVIGLVVITIPMILISNARHVERNLLQEAVLMASTKMGQNMAHRWDEHSWDENGTLHKTEAVNVSNSGNVLLKRANFNQLYTTSPDSSPSNFRIGHFFLEPLHRRMTPSTVTDRNASNIEDDDGGDYDDIDDIVDHAETLDMSGLAAGLYGHGYKSDYNITGVVEYVSDAPTGGTPAGANYNSSTIEYQFPVGPGTGATTAASSTNIKRVEIRIDADNTPENPDVVLRAYSCNIGETDYYKRTY